jgi:dUTP pyrophosphatase
VPITNHNTKPLLITKEADTEHLQDDFIVYPYSKAICQAVLLPVPKVQINEISYEELKEFKSERGMGHLGSSGK